MSEYQRKENLTVTSRLDPETLGKLEVGVGGATRKPQSPNGESRGRVGQRAGKVTSQLVFFFSASARPTDMSDTWHG